MKNLSKLKSKLDDLKKQSNDPRFGVHLDLAPLVKAIDELADSVVEEKHLSFEKIEALLDEYKIEYIAKDDETIKQIKAVSDLVNSVKLETEELKKKEIKFPEFPEVMDIKEPKWYQPFSDSKILNLLGSLKTAILVGLRQVQKANETALDPKNEALRTVLIDPETGLPYKARGGSMGGSSGPGTILVEGYAEVGDGTATVTAAGTREQLPNIACRKVLIQAHESNAGVVVIGGATVVGALIGRRGYALFSTQSQVFNVRNLNQLYIDSTENGDKINYYYEN